MKELTKEEKQKLSKIIEEKLKSNLRKEPILMKSKQMVPEVKIEKQPEKPVKTEPKQEKKEEKKATQEIQEEAQIYQSTTDQPIQRTRIEDLLLNSGQQQLQNLDSLEAPNLKKEEEKTKSPIYDSRLYSASEKLYSERGEQKSENPAIRVNARMRDVSEIQEIRTPTIQQEFRQRVGMVRTDESSWGSRSGENKVYEPTLDRNQLENRNPGESLDDMKKTRKYEPRI